jgi:hypothetical protein
MSARCTTSRDHAWPAPGRRPCSTSSHAMAKTVCAAGASIVRSRLQGPRAHDRRWGLARSAPRPAASPTTAGTLPRAVGAGQPRGRTTAPRGDAPGRETPGPRPPRPSRPERICLCAPPGTAHRAVEAGGRRGRTARAWQAGPRPRAPGQEPPRPGPCSRTEAASLAGAALPVCSCEPMGLTTEPRPRLAGVGRGARADGAGGRRAAGCRTRDAGAPPPRLGLETSRAELGSARCGSVSK